jgi:hypothetical protein
MPGELFLMPKLTLDATILSHYAVSPSGLEHKMKIEIVHCPT